MWLRRILGIVLSASVANVAIAGTDLVCAKHAVHQPASADAMTGMHHHGAEQPSKEACKVPARSNCCDAMTSCATGAALASSPDDSARAIAVDVVSRSIDDVPLSRLTAP